MVFRVGATLIFNGIINGYNYRYYSEQRPNCMFEKHTQHTRKFHVWARTFSGQVEWPFFLDGN